MHHGGSYAPFSKAYTLQILPAGKWRTSIAETLNRMCLFGQRLDSFLDICTTTTPFIPGLPPTHTSQPAFLPVLAF
jgi:hypothetical protein